MNCMEAYRSAVELAPWKTDEETGRTTIPVAALARILAPFVDVFGAPLRLPDDPADRQAAIRLYLVASLAKPHQPPGEKDKLAKETWRAGNDKFVDRAFVAWLSSDEALAIAAGNIDAAKVAGVCESGEGFFHGKIPDAGISMPVLVETLDVRMGPAKEYGGAGSLDGSFPASFGGSAALQRVANLLSRRIASGNGSVPFSEMLLDEGQATSILRDVVGYSEAGDILSSLRSRQPTVPPDTVPTRLRTLLIPDATTGDHVQLTPVAHLPSVHATTTMIARCRTRNREDAFERRRTIGEAEERIKGLEKERKAIAVAIRSTRPGSAGENPADHAAAIARSLDADTAIGKARIVLDALRSAHETVPVDDWPTIDLSIGGENPQNAGSVVAALRGRMTCLAGFPPRTRRTPWIDRAIAVARTTRSLLRDFDRENARRIALLDAPTTRDVSVVRDAIDRRVYRAVEQVLVLFGHRDTVLAAVEKPEEAFDPIQAAVLSRGWRDVEDEIRDEFVEQVRLRMARNLVAAMERQRDRRRVRECVEEYLTRGRASA